MNTVGSVKRKKAFFSTWSGSGMAHPVSTIIQYVTGMTTCYLIFQSYNLKLLFCFSYHTLLSS